MLDLYENNDYEVLKRTAEVLGEKARERKCQNLLYSRQLKKKNVIKAFLECCGRV